jgi:hypothetical protein
MIPTDAYEASIIVEAMTTSCRVPGCPWEPEEVLPAELLHLELNLCSKHVDHLVSVSKRLEAEVPALDGIEHFLRGALLREAQALVYPSIQPRLELLE